MQFLTSRFQAMRARYRAYEESKLAELPQLEIDEIRAFDRWLRESPLLSWGSTIAAWLVISFLTHLAVPKLPWWGGLLVGACLLVCAATVLIAAWFGHRKFKLTLRMFVIITVLAMLGAVFGAAVGAGMRGGVEVLLESVQSTMPKVLLAGLVVGMLYATVITIFVLIRRKQLEVRNRELVAIADRERLARQLADAKLKLMQAQVEPHFLFNTLASVQQLAEAPGRAQDAATLTRELITFLRAGLLGLRGETTTLKAEFEMATAYLAIMRTRMGARLRVSIDLPDDLAPCAVPPAMLISLVENAIKHGLEPSVEGGEIAVSARADDGTLNIRVADTGLGLQIQNPQHRSDSSGVGLLNIRERLAAIFGDAASLTIEENAPRGVVATIKIPNQTESTPQ